MAHNLSYERMMEYRTAFEFFDKDRSGSITTKELGNVVRNLGQNLSDTQLKEMVLEVDSDGSGTIDFSEFIGLIIRKMKESDLEDEMKEAFKIFDKDGNKVITAHELREIFMNLKDIPEEDVEEMIREADLDNDGQIDYEEFIKMLNTK